MNIDAFVDCNNLVMVNITDINAWLNIVFANSHSNPLSYAKHLYINDAEVTELVVSNNVTQINNYAFNYCESLNSISIPNSVASIGTEAFRNCTSLTSVTIPNSITSIGNAVFSGCPNLTSVTINSNAIVNKSYSDSNNFKNIFGAQVRIYILGEGITGIGDYAFQNYTGLASVTIPNSVTSIGYSAFSGCSGLTSVNIPNSVTSIESNAFDGCTGLTKVNIADIAAWCNIAFGSSTSNPLYYAQRLYLDNAEVKNLVIPNSVTSIRDYTFYNCSSLTSVTIPNSVTSIGRSAFSGCSSLTSVTIPDSVTYIFDGAFAGCRGLTSVNIPQGVTSIPESVFSGCSNLKSVTINSNAIVSHNYNALNESTSIRKIFGSQVQRYVIGDSVTSIGILAFKDCSGLTSVTIGNSVTSIGESAFSGCSSLTSATIPNSVKSIGRYAFGGCNLNTINFKGSLEDWLKKTWSPAYFYHNYQLQFDGVLKKNIVIPNSVTNIKDNAFEGCSSLTSVTIDNNVTSIGLRAFLSCSSLTSVTIPNSVTSIANSAFSGCSSLTSVKIGNGVTSIGDYAFSECYNLTSITIGNSVTNIGSSVFKKCNNITSVIWNAINCNSYNFGSQVTSFTFGDEVEVVPASICSGMSNLTSVTIGNSVTSIGEEAFYGCNQVRSVEWKAKNSNGWYFGSQVENFVFGDSVEIIPDDLCKNMSKLSELKIPNCVVSIGNNAFKDCGNDGNLFFPSSLKTIGDYAFKGWTKVKKINIPNGVTKIGVHAFDSCYLATSIYLGSSVEEIGDYAFKGCVRVNEITSMNTNAPIAFGNTLTSISPNAYLYVPAGSKRAYQIDPYWSRFNIYEIAAEESSLTKDAVTVEANDDNAIFTWPTNTEAASYSLQITKDGVVFCTLVFNSNGQLTGIAFAPGRNGASHAPAATMSVAGMSFTVTGLDGASKYAYRLAVTNDASEELVAYSGEFATTGYDGEVNPGGNPEGIEDVFTDEHKASKILHNGQIYILRGEKVYTLTGQEVK